MCSDFSNCSRLKMSSTTELTELKELQNTMRKDTILLTFRKLVL